jgi:WD40 repeat protein
MDIQGLLLLLLLQGTTGRKIGDLRGHTSSVCSIALDDSLNHVFTLSIDKSIKVWDLRNHRCLQTISEVSAHGACC